MSSSRSIERFSNVFDRAVLACAMAERLVISSAQAGARARATVASSRRIRALALETRDCWANADRVFGSMRRQVERVATQMRRDGMDRRDTATAVRARVRFVLYDGGFHEAEAEPVVARASEWVDELFAAA
jgi:hypothetical protein